MRLKNNWYFLFLIQTDLILDAYTLIIFTKSVIKEINSKYTVSIRKKKSHKYMHVVSLEAKGTIFSLQKQNLLYFKK